MASFVIPHYRLKVVSLYMTFESVGCFANHTFTGKQRSRFLTKFSYQILGIALYFKWNLSVHKDVLFMYMKMEHKWNLCEYDGTRMYLNMYYIYTKM